MRILQLCPKVPWPPEDGGRVAMRTLALSLASAGAEVKVLALNPAKLRADPSSFPEEARALGLEAVDVETRVTAAGALRSLLFGGSYHVARFRSADFERRVVEAVRRTPPDVVLLESPFLVTYAPALRRATSARLVLRSHNVEHRIWEALARSADGVARRLYLGHLARRLRTFELATLGDVDAILPITAEDEAAYRALGAPVPLLTTPVGVPKAAFADRTGPGDPRALLFLGALDWRPNVEAVRWFLGTAWPLVRRAVPDARFLVAGSNPPPELLRSVAGEGVRFLGRVPDARDFLASGAAMVVPLLSGAGMRVKILEAMALGVPVVSTRLGADGIGARNGEEILLAETPKGLTEACIELLTAPEKALAIGRAGQRRVRAAFDAESIARRLLAFVEHLPGAPESQPSGARP